MPRIQLKQVDQISRKEVSYRISTEWRSSAAMLVYLLISTWRKSSFLETLA